MENNRIVILDDKNEIINVKTFDTAEAAYEEYTSKIRLIKNFIRNGEQFTVIRMRWDSIMAMETIGGAC